MSKRSGDFVTLREVVDQVGSDAVRFMMLFRKTDAVLDFDLAKVLEQSKDNPVFYVQYGHAPRPFDFKNAREVIPDLPEDDGARSAFLGDAAVERLTNPAELSLLRQLAQYPRLIDAAAVAHGNRIESPFTSMILPANFMRCGPGGAICPIYASLSLMMQRSRRRDGTRPGRRLDPGIWLSRSRRPCSGRDAIVRPVGQGKFFQGQALTWGSVRASGSNWFVCKSGLAAFPKGRIITMADRYQDRPFPPDDAMIMAIMGIRLQEPRATRWPSWRV